MGDVVNLRQFRKKRARADTEKRAEANRLQSGRTKAERKLADAENSLAERKLDSHLRGTSDDGQKA
jgi:hypothetical protein